jgi:hypothetical protein
MRVLGLRKDKKESNFRSADVSEAYIPTVQIQILVNINYQLALIWFDFS